MFCFKCGQSDQSPETYCRQCGIFLRDPDQPAKKKTTPEDHIKANSFLSLMTAIVSLALAISLNTFVIKSDGTHWLIYVVMGFLFAISAWQVQTFIRMRMLKRQIEKMRPSHNSVEPEDRLKPAQDTQRLLDEADLSNVVPASVTENTTKNLVGRKRSA